MDNSFKSYDHHYTVLSVISRPIYQLPIGVVGTPSHLHTLPDSLLSPPLPLSECKPNVMRMENEYRFIRDRYSIRSHTENSS
jgi:hypothetical protein